MICPTCKINCNYICPCCGESVNSAWHMTEDAKAYGKTVKEDERIFYNNKLEGSKGNVSLSTDFPLVMENRGLINRIKNWIIK
jgi:hypothetical protein